MTSHRLRWALLCVAATQGVLISSSANASQTHVVGKNDSVDSLARKYHVSVKAIAQANGITAETLLKDGRKLIIPDPPKPVVQAATARLASTIKGDRISVRFGPDEAQQRLTLLDHGAPVTVTHQTKDWVQVKLPSGKTGWVRTAFVAIGSAKPVVLPDKPASAAKVAKKAQSNSLQNHKAVASKSHNNKRQDVAESRHKSSKKRHVAVHQRRHSSRRTALRGRRSSRPEADAPEADSEVVRTALAYRGTPYHFGGTSSRGFDCSGFTGHVYAKKGVSLPRTASDQFSRGSKVTRGEMKQGDLVFFHTTRKGISHVGIYAGDGKFVHASSGGGRVRVDSLDSGYYKQRLVGAKRVK